MVAGQAWQQDERGSRTSEIMLVQTTALRVRLSAVVLQLIRCTGAAGICWCCEVDTRMSLLRHGLALRQLLPSCTATELPMTTTNPSTMPEHVIGLWIDALLDGLL